MNKNINIILSLRDQFSGGIRSVANNLQGFDREARSATNTIRNLGDRANKTFTGIAKGAAALGAIGGIAFFKSSMDTFSEFEQSMANVKALTNATDDTFQDLQNAALEMGKKTSKTAKEAADALGYMSLAGWDANTSIAALEPVLRLSEAGGLELAKTSDLVTDSMSALGMGVDDLPGYLDKLAQSSRKSNTAIDQMMEGYLKVGGTMNRLNVPMEESATVLGMLANRGLKGSEAGQALSSVMVNLTAPTGQAATALDKLKFSAFDANGNFKGLETVLFDLKDKMSGLTQEERENMIAMVAGKEQLKTFSAVLDGLDNEYFDLKNSISNSDGALMDMAKTMNATMQGAFKRAESAIDDFKINMMMQLAPYITKVVDLFAEKLPIATEKFSAALGKGIEKATPTIKTLGEGLKWIGERADTLIPIVLNLVGAWATYNATMAVSTAARNINTFGKGIMSMGRSITFLSTATVQGGKTAMLLKGITAAAGLLKAVFLANPFGAFILGLAAVAAGLMYAYKKSDTFRAGVQGLWTKFKSLATGLKTEVMPTIENLKTLFLMLWNNVLKPIGGMLAGSFLDAFKVVFPAISAIVSFNLDQIFNIFKAVNGVLQGLTDFLLGVFTGDWKRAFEGIKKVFQSVFDYIKNTVTNVIDKFIGGLTGVKNAVGEILGMDTKNTLQTTPRKNLPGYTTGTDYFTVGLAGINSGGTFAKTEQPKPTASILQQNLPGHATGTTYFSGGLTRINEGNRGEIVNLPNGTQIVPHDVSTKTAKKQEVSVTVVIQGDVIGEEKYIDKIGNIIGNKVLAAINNS